MLSIRKVATTAAAIGGVALGGAAIAGAADDNAATHNRPQRETLSGDAAAKVKQAALEKVPGATVLRTEGGGPYGTPYHAHVKTSDGTLEVVLVDASFTATAVEADDGRRAPGGRGPHGDRDGGGPGETALTGTTKQQVEAAVKARYPSAAIERTETNGDSAAPYESHVTTKAGQELEVLVSEDFEVVDAREHPARP